MINHHYQASDPIRAPEPRRLPPLPDLNGERPKGIE
jgi:hypothetical protein